MRNKFNVTIHSLLSIVLTAIMLAVTPLKLQAEESILSKDWQFDAQIYVWAADFSGDMHIDIVDKTVPFDIPFSTLVDNLKMGFYGSFEARKEKWLIFTDVVYLNVETDHAAPDPGNIFLAPSPRSISMNGGAVNLVGGYNLLVKGKSRLDLIAGARYLDLGSEFALHVDSTIAGKTTTLFFPIDMGTALDAVIGVKGKYAFANANRWSIPYYLDIGAGDSDFTWQALTGISYQAATWVDVALTYRHMEWDLKSTDGVIDNVSFSGPSFGAIFHF